MKTEKIKTLAEKYCSIAMEVDKAVLHGLRIIICDDESASQGFVGLFSEKDNSITIWPENLQKEAEQFAVGRGDVEGKADYILKMTCFHEVRHLWQKLNGMAYSAGEKCDPYYPIYREKLKSAKPLSKNPTVDELYETPWELDAYAYSLLLMKTIFDAELMVHRNVAEPCRALMHEMWPYYRENVLKIKEALFKNGIF